MSVWSRRSFLAVGAAAAMTRRSTAQSAASDRVRVGVIGTGGRARGLMNLLKKVPGAELVAVCDVYEPRLLQAAEIAGPAALRVADYRRILDQRDVDAVLIGAPDHWHKTMTLDALAAGKDVYVEKPVSHSIADGVAMVKAVESSSRIVQTGMQQRSWDHWILGKRLVDEGRLGHITFAQTYWYQRATAGPYGAVDTAKLDWRSWLGPAPDRAFDPARFHQWRHFWDYGGGGIADLMTHWIDVVQWYMDVNAPLVVTASGQHHRIATWDAPDTTTVSMEFPKRFTGTYLGSYVSRVDDGGIVLRGEKGTLEVDRSRLAFYRDEAPYVAGALRPEPEIYVRSSGDGSLPHLQNWIDCIRSRKTPNAPIRVGHQAARTSHLANVSLRNGGRVVRWNAATEAIE